MHETHTRLLCNCHNGPIFNLRKQQLSQTLTEKVRRWLPALACWTFLSTLAFWNSKPTAVSYFATGAYWTPRFPDISWDDGRNLGYSWVQFSIFALFILILLAFLMVNYDLLWLFTIQVWGLLKWFSPPLFWGLSATAIHWLWPWSFAKDHCCSLALTYFTAPSGRRQATSL